MREIKDVSKYSIDTLRLSPAFAQAVKKARIRRGLTQKQFSIFSGVSLSTISRFENGDVGVSWANVMDILSALDRFWLEDLLEDIQIDKKARKYQDRDMPQKVRMRDDDEF